MGNNNSNKGSFFLSNPTFGPNLASQFKRCTDYRLMTRLLDGLRPKDSCYLSCDLSAQIQRPERSGGEILELDGGVNTEI